VQANDSMLSLQKRANNSVLENAGITKGNKTNSDRYLASRLTREFDAALSQLSISTDSLVGKSQVFDILVQLMLLKSMS